MRLLILVVALSGCVVVQPPKDGARPRWRIIGERTDWTAGCVRARAFVRKSGNAGIGVAIQLRSTRDCHVGLTGGRLVFADGRAVEIPASTTVDLRGRSLIYTWLPIRFDNAAAWNDDRDDARLELAYSVDGSASSVWQIPIHQGPP